MTTTVTENELKELKDFIGSKFEEVNSRLDQVDTKIEKLSENLNEVKVELATIKESISGLDTRVKNLEFTNRGIFISISAGLVLATLGALGALIKFLLFDVNM